MISIYQRYQGVHVAHVAPHTVFPHSPRKLEKNLLNPFPDVAAKVNLHHSVHQVESNRNYTYTLRDIQQKAVEASQKAREMERVDTSTAKLESPSSKTYTSKPTTIPIQDISNSVASNNNIDDIILYDGVNTHSLGKNIDIRITDGDLIVNGTDHYTFNESSNLRVYQLYSPGTDGSRQENDLINVANGVATVNHASNFDVYEDGTTTNPDASYLQVQIINGELPNQSPIKNSLFFGNGTNATPVGNLVVQGSDYMLTSNDKTQMVFSLQDSNGEYFIWEVHSDPDKITAAFNDIHSRSQNEIISYDQLQEMVRSHGIL
jgi:hypothetical protein